MAKNRYPLNQSPLYKVVGMRRLEAVLRIDISKLDRLLAPENYRVWVNKDGRVIQQPLKWLAQVHKRIGDLLSRVEVPDYVFSQKGRSYADNARQHTGNFPLGKTDIWKFYPSTTRYSVWRMFSRDFKCANDVADVLADICCFQQKHLPTGSFLSGPIAFFAALPMFDAICERAITAESRMTLYVDDLTFSGPTVSKNLISQFRQIIRRHGFKTKQSKTRTFPADAPKTVTGVVVVGNKVRLPNLRHRKIWETRRAIRIAIGEEKSWLMRSLKGRIQEAKQMLVNPI